MENPMLKALKSSQNRSPDIFQQFNDFKNQMYGRNPQQIVEDMVRSGQMSEQQKNDLLQKAQAMINMFR